MKELKESKGNLFQRVKDKTLGQGDTAIEINACLTCMEVLGLISSLISSLITETGKNQEFKSHLLAC